MSDKPTFRRGRDQYGQNGSAHAVIDLYRLRGAFVAEPVDETVPSVEVRLNHGRWLVECSCLNAQLADENDERFYCIRCNNPSSAGKWLSVTWPSNVDEIENVLAVRPIENRNWSPGDIVEDLKAENVAHGLPEIWE